MKTNPIRWAWLAIVLALMGSWSAQAAAAGCAALEVPSVIQLRKGFHMEFDLPVPVRRVAVGDPGVVNLQLTSRQSVLLLGLKDGVTNLSLWTRCASEPLQSMVFIEGQATTDLMRPIRSPVQVAAVPSQVQTDIRFVEVNRSKLRELGVSLFAAGSRSKFFGAPGTLPNSGGVVGLASDLMGTAGINVPDTGFNILWGGGSKRVLGALNALENSGFAYTLSQPSLVALSGQSASFLAGGEFPVPVPSTGSDSISIDYKPYGVKLNLTPTVVDQSRILLKVAPEVSELDFNSGIVIAGTSVPALNVRRTDTTVSLADGESFVISGLIDATNASVVDKLPGLGDIPVLGALFRSSRIEREERELLMIVTPRLVNPLATDAQLPDLPGESLRQYNPGGGDMLLLENGDFDQRSARLPW